MRYLGESVIFNPMRRPKRRLVRSSLGLSNRSSDSQEGSLTSAWTGEPFERPDMATHGVRHAIRKHSLGFKERSSYQNPELGEGLVECLNSTVTDRQQLLTACTGVS